jgi:endonuclease/exonuclease/phosphatase family metal-dependent hydrolase
MQSSESQLQKSAMEEKQVRKQQLQEIVRWTKDLEIPEDESVFVAGDYNIENDSPEFVNTMAAIPLEINYEKDEEVSGSLAMI